MGFLVHDNVQHTLNSEYIASCEILPMSNHLHALGYFPYSWWYVPHALVEPDFQRYRSSGCAVGKGIAVGLGAILIKLVE